MCAISERFQAGAHEKREAIPALPEMTRQQLSYPIDDGDNLSLDKHKHIG
jgi:hypothetical protein